MNKILALVLGLIIFSTQPVFATGGAVYKNQPDYAETASIASSGTTSVAVDLNGNTLCGILTPSAMTSTTLTFTMSTTLTGTYLPVVDNTNTAVSIAISTGAAKYYALDPKLFVGIRYLKVVSGSAEGAQRVLTLSSRQFSN